jgi:hypothetical protein
MRARANACQGKCLPGQMLARANACQGKCSSLFGLFTSDKEKSFKTLTNGVHILSLYSSALWQNKLEQGVQYLKGDNLKLFEPSFQL